MKRLSKIRVFFCKMWKKIKSWFGCEKSLWRPDTDNLPANPDNIKQGEIGAYVLYNKNKATIDKNFVYNLQELGIDIVYLNTNRKGAPLSYDEWYSIFELFRESGIKIRLYIYEAVSLKPQWTIQQIKSISEHPAFDGWIAEDEVTMASYSTSNAWIKRMHSQFLSDGERKFPNMSITYLPKLSTLKADAIGEKYADYLDTWSDAADTVFADQYPFIADKTDGAHYNIEEDGTPMHGKTAGGEKWFDYLNEHLAFTHRHPELTHRLYIQTCKHIANDNKKQLYIAHPKPTPKTLAIQAYASLMAGSDGLMLFLLNDIHNDNGTGFMEAAFAEDLSINEDTYNNLKALLTSKKFQNFKKLITNLETNMLGLLGYGIKLEAFAMNDKYYYAFILNTSLTESASYKISENDIVMDLENNKAYYPKEKEEYILSAGDVLVFKHRKDYAIV